MIWCISKRATLRKKQSYKIPRRSSYVPDRAPHARPLGTLQCDRTQVGQSDYKRAALTRLGWVTQASLGERLLGVSNRALRSALSAIGWSGPIDCSVQRIRAQDLARKAGFNFCRECVHQEEKTQQLCALNISVHTELIFADCFFMLQKFLFFINSIPFYMILNSSLAIF